MGAELQPCFMHWPGTADDRPQARTEVRCIRQMLRSFNAAAKSRGAADSVRANCMKIPALPASAND